MNESFQSWIWDTDDAFRHQSAEPFLVLKSLELADLRVFCIPDLTGIVIPEHSSFAVPLIIRQFAPSIEISGRRVAELKAALQEMKAKQRAIIDWYTPAVRPSPRSGVVDDTLASRLAAIATDCRGTGPCANVLPLPMGQLLSEVSLVEECLRAVRERIVTFVRQLKAIKRAMRQRQRDEFCGCSFAKKVWFLLHGSHPPKASLHASVCLSFGGARA